MSRFVIFSGTTEGRLLSRELAALGEEVTVCVATDYGREEQGEAPDITVRTGRLDKADMAALLVGECAAVAIDATHPYAAEASANLRAACRQAGVEYMRLLRKASDMPPDALRAKNAKDAAELLAGTEGNILLTTGAKELADFAALGGGRLYPRVLPLASSLAECEKAGIPRANIIAMQGPFSAKLNAALIEEYKIRWLVTKDGGAAGGFAEKATAAVETGARLVVIDRPADAGVDYETILQECRKRIQCR